MKKESNQIETFKQTMKELLCEYYHNVLSENIKRGIQRRISGGEYVGKAPFGYCYAIENGKSKLVLSKPDGEIVGSIFTNFNADSSLQNIQDLILAQFNTKLNRSKIHRILQNRFYCGFISSKTDMKEYRHIYPTIISETVFNQANENLMKNNNGHNNSEIPRTTI